MKTDPTNPAHYRFSPIEPIHCIEAWQLGFNLGNCVKYIARADHKGTKLLDLQKAAWYLQREISNLQKELEQQAGCYEAVGVSFTAGEEIEPGQIVFYDESTGTVNTKPKEIRTRYEMSCPVCQHDNIYTNTHTKDVACNHCGYKPFPPVYDLSALFACDEAHVFNHAYNTNGDCKRVTVDLLNPDYGSNSKCPKCNGCGRLAKGMTEKGSFCVPATKLHTVTDRLGPCHIDPCSCVLDKLGAEPPDYEP